jgi:flagellar P-ring protein precursor FlgI
MALRIRDVVRLKNETPNELVGMGIVVGLSGTGDGGDFMPTMRPLRELLKRFDDPIALDKELKNANNVAIVTLSMMIPKEGSHSGEKLDVKVSALAAKSLRGGRLFIVPMYSPVAPPPGVLKEHLATASGTLRITNDLHPTEATITGGGTLLTDFLPEEITENKFTLVLHPRNATRELATAIAEQINEDVSPQTGGRTIAVAVDATSVQVTIPEVERANPTPFIARIMTLPLPLLPEPAKVRINLSSETMVFTEEVEIAPTVISHKDLTIVVGQPANQPGSRQPFVAVDAHNKAGSVKLRELESALNMLKVSAKERIAIVQELWENNVLKADLIVEQ